MRPGRSFLSALFNTLLVVVQHNERVSWKEAPKPAIKCCHGQALRQGSGRNPRVRDVIANELVAAARLFEPGPLGTECDGFHARAVTQGREEEPRFWLWCGLAKDTRMGDDPQKAGRYHGEKAEDGFTAIRPVEGLFEPRSSDRVMRVVATRSRDKDVDVRDHESPSAASSRSR